MSYEKQNFTDGQVLTAAQLNHMEEGIYQAQASGGGVLPRLSSVTIYASAWTGSDNLHSQVVSINDVTPFSKVDLLPSVQQLAMFQNKNVSFVTENEDGTVTVYAIGDKPEQDYTMQVQLTEVEA